MKETRKINWADLSQSRGVLMGIAIIAIVLFHVALPRTSPFFGLKRMGNLGVDVFFFLSGIGLWFAWSKQPDVCHFYKRRLLRILPAWLIVSTAFYLKDFMTVRHFSSSIVDLLGDITINWDFWLHDELTFWYIPATLMLYLWAPWYMRLINKQPAWRWLPVLLIAWCVAVQYVGCIHQSVGHIEIFWSRVPIFFIGIVAGQQVQRQQEMEAGATAILVLTTLLCLSLCIVLEQTMHGRFPIFLERMVYIPLTLTSTLLASHYLVQAPRWLTASLTFVGTISLEIYLLHCHFILVYLEPLRLGYWATALGCLFITLPLAWLLHKIVQILIKTLRL